MNPRPEQYLFRPVRADDLDAIIELVDSLTDSITTILPDPDFLRRRIQKSLRGFHPSVDQPGDEQYLFVLEGPEGLLGTSAIIARVGGFQPFYTFETIEERFEHAPLQVSKSMPALRLRISHDGPSEIGSLFLHPRARGKGLARLLSHARFLFMACFPERFCDEVIAELRGYVDEKGTSPFWESVGKPFFGQEFSEADFLSGLGNKEFIRDLMPRHPLYIKLLPESAQAVIGEIHPDTRGARALLEQDGFQRTSQVDIFDAGPLYQTKTRKLRTVNNAQQFTLLEIRADSDSDSIDFMASDGKLNFRSCLASATVSKNGCILSSSTANTLRLNTGDDVWIAPLKGTLSIN